MSKKDQDQKTENSDSKKKYVKPEMKSEEVLEAGLGQVCNGSSGGGRKAVGPCTIIKT